MLKLSSSRGIRIDVPVLSVSWSFEDHSVIIKALRIGLIEHEASDTGGVPRWKSSCPDRLAEATRPGTRSTCPATGRFPLSVHACGHHVAGWLRLTECEPNLKRNKLTNSSWGATTSWSPTHCMGFCGLLPTTLATIADPTVVLTVPQG